ncbi:MAG TPA: type II toxin-antitoxin system RelE/ParE family toxin [Acidobacteriaceae bacterium]|nr:type II toxin-antitoxin system RelE/ParE family toxin [Acidobacteriaceae bacterium]
MPQDSRSAYRLTHEALDDIDALTYNIAEHSGWDRSMRVEAQLFAAFDEIARTPGIGHLRLDLIPADIYVHLSDPYLILHRRDTQPVVILAVLHGSRDVAAIMQKRAN